MRSNPVGLLLWVKLELNTCGTWRRVRHKSSRSCQSSVLLNFYQETTTVTSHRLCIRKLTALNLQLWKWLCSLHQNEQPLAKDSTYFPSCVCILVEEANGQRWSCIYKSNTEKHSEVNTLPVIKFVKMQQFSLLPKFILPNGLMSHKGKELL